MRLIGYLLIALGLVVGVIATSTAYLVPLSLGDEVLIGTIIGADAGSVTLDDGTLAPIVWATDADGNPTRLDAAMIEQLRAANVEYVRSKAFVFSHWPMRFAFIAAVLGLLAGGTLLRVESKRSAARAASAERAATDTPEHLLEQIASGVDTLRATAGADLVAQTIEIVGRMQNEHVPAFADKRAELVGRFGLARFAQIMDAFSGAERSLNRAWSAAADGFAPEVMPSLEQASERIENARRLLA